jgi:UDP-N-acetylglucosamine transferase subunit ALG13
MHTDGFSRLVKEMDRFAAQADEEVVMQIGATPYRPRAARWFACTTQEEMDTLCEQARIIVSHAGAGSILTALRHNKPLIVVPRQQKYGEVIDDHQLELAEALSQAGALLVAYETGELSARLKATDGFTPRVPNRSRLVEAVRQAVLTDTQKRR